MRCETHAARGASETVKLDKVNVSPFVIAFGVVRAAENRKVPALMVSHTAMCEIVTEPPVHDVQDGVDDAAQDPDDDAE